MNFMKNIEVWKLERKLRGQLKLFMAHLDVGRPKSDPIVQAVRDRILVTLADLAKAKGCNVQDLYVDYPGLAIIEDSRKKPSLARLAGLIVFAGSLLYYFAR